MIPSGQSGKRRPSKRVVNARRLMRSSHLLHEFDEDDHDWNKERKHNIHRSQSSASKTHDYRVTKLKNREAYKTHQDEY
jgi:hypothetical protein